MKKLQEDNDEGQRQILGLEEILENTNSKYYELLAKQKEMSPKKEDKNVTETPSKYHYDLLKMEHENTQDALKDKEKLGNLRFLNFQNNK